MRHGQAPVRCGRLHGPAVRVFRGIFRLANARMVSSEPDGDPTIGSHSDSLQEACVGDGRLWRGARSLEQRGSVWSRWKSMDAIAEHAHRKVCDTLWDLYKLPIQFGDGQLTNDFLDSWKESTGSCSCSYTNFKMWVVRISLNMKLDGSDFRLLDTVLTFLGNTRPRRLIFCLEISTWSQIEFRCLHTTRPIAGDGRIQWCHHLQQRGIFTRPYRRRWCQQYGVCQQRHFNWGLETAARYERGSQCSELLRFERPAARFFAFCGAGGPL